MVDTGILLEKWCPISKMLHDILEYAIHCDNLQRSNLKLAHDLATEFDHLIEFR